MAQSQILLLKDVKGLGRKGEIVKAAAGYVRNFLEPKGHAVSATKQALKRQTHLKEEREVQTVADRSESEGVASNLKQITMVIERKADHDGHMYGSVSILDLSRELEEKNKIVLDKNFFKLEHPIKEFGVHTVPLELKEHVEAHIIVKVLREGELAQETATEDEPSE